MTPAKCDLCMTWMTRGLLALREDCWPARWLCVECEGRLDAEDDAGECECRGGCRDCLAVRGML